MPKVRKAEDGFNLAFLDVMACGLGAVILIFILVDFKAFTPDPTEEKEKLEQELAAAEQEQQKNNKREKSELPKKQQQQFNWYFNWYFWSFLHFY